MCCSCLNSYSDWVINQKTGPSETIPWDQQGIIEDDFGDGETYYYVYVRIGYNFATGYSHCSFVGFDDPQNPQNVTAVIPGTEWYENLTWQGSEPPNERWDIYGSSHYYLKARAGSGLVASNTSKSSVGIYSPYVQIEHGNYVYDDNSNGAASVLEINNGNASIYLGWPPALISPPIPDRYDDEIMGYNHTQHVQKTIFSSGTYVKSYGFFQAYAQTDLNVQVPNEPFFGASGTAKIDIEFSYTLP